LVGPSLGGEWGREGGSDPVDEKGSGLRSWEGRIGWVTATGGGG